VISGFGHTSLNKIARVGYYYNAGVAPFDEWLVGTANIRSIY
jgi:hypothetical protein